MNLSVAFTVFYFFLSINAAISTVWSVEKFPNPQKDLEKCGRKGVASWICDPDGILQYREANIVEGLLKQIALAKESYANSPCGSDEIPGFQVAVAIMNETSLNPLEDSNTAALQFAKDLLTKWGVGHAECNDGVLLAVMIQNRKIAVATGKGAKNRLNTDKVIDGMKPYMKRKEYEAGVKKGVYEIGDELSKGTVSRIVEYIIPAGFVALVAACMCGSFFTGRKKKTAKEKIEILKQAELAVRDGTYEATSCPVCFDRFERPQGDHRDDSDEEDFDEWGPLLFKHKNNELSEKDRKRLNEKKKLPVTLQCGHSFCEPCLLEWLDHNETCPICRKPIPQVSGASSYPTTYSTSNHRWTTDTWDPEMQFRLNRLRYLYPAYMTPGMMDMWLMDYRLGRDFDYRNHQDFKAWDPAQQSKLENFGSSGAAGGFGGGHADGGGGSAGGW